eukprot:14002863-Alexandrium_andersonii.AAC.1
MPTPVLPGSNRGCQAPVGSELAVAHPQLGLVPGSRLVLSLLLVVLGRPALEPVERVAHAPLAPLAVA